MTNLDDPEVYKKLDPQGMLTHLHEMPAQCRSAWQMAMDFNLPQDYSRINKVVILGMGGSAIGGDLVNSLAVNEATLPIMVCRDYNLPGYVDAGTLVIASSYSGNTEETLTAFGQALETKAKKLAITTGGKLKTLAEKNGVPVFIFDYKSPPRAALPYSFLTILGILQKLGCIKDKSADVAEMVDVLERMARKIDEKAPESRNHAKQLAQKLFCKLAVIYGSGILAEAARRWKTQVNENGKAWAFHEVFPELTHNAVVGYQFPKEMPDWVYVVFLRSNLLNDRVLLRYEITQQMLKQARVEYQVVEAEGRSAVSHLGSTVLFGDYVSYYLALLYQIDPTP
ncbi:MAG: bifunctional phosphoglucose/phosphomannose isomerase, partial [Dehalococcoidia bacterium]|nr:bifunctional phosphoglucose/phosphomannose isomerase [Dehalococcoidia bacterium]